MGRENRVGPYEASQNPDLAELFRVALRAERLSIRTHSLCTVKGYDPATQKVRVVVDILQVVNDNTKEPTGLDPNPSTVQMPVELEDINVAWPRTSSGYLTFPINEDDKGELHIQDRDIDAWLSEGGPVDPVAMWTHAMSGAVFHPAIFNDDNPITPATDQTATVLEGELVNIGRAATLPAARVTDTVAAGASMATWIAAVNTAFAALVPPVIIPPPVDFGAIATGSAKVKVE